jgi:ABC-type uncharacterized transport system YnjBCD permease subunit
LIVVHAVGAAGFSIRHHCASWVSGAVRIGAINHPITVVVHTVGAADFSIRQLAGGISGAVLVVAINIAITVIIHTVGTVGFRRWRRRRTVGVIPIVVQIAIVVEAYSK